MAERYGFFDPIKGENELPDRNYNAQQFTDYFKSLVTTGVMKGAGNELAVSTGGSNMVTTIDIGVAFLEGRFYENDSLLSTTHDTETLGKNRIDRIVIRMDLNTEARHVKAFIKKGVASTSPVPPSLQRDNLVHEISLAQVKVIGGQTYINIADVVDERGTKDICPWAGSSILPNFDDSSVGQPNGIATLDSAGNVPMEQLKNVPLPQDATTLQKGVVKLNDSITSNSVTEAATPNAVKQVNDKFKSQSIELGEGSQSFGLYGMALGINTSASPYSSSIGYGAYSSNIKEGVLGDSSGEWKVPGTFSVTGTKNFEIPHPHPDKKATHVIRHGAVESPTPGDTLYRYAIEALEDNQTVELQLPDYFEHLNANVDVWVNPHKHFGRAFGEVIGDKLLVTCEKAGTYKALVIGTRNDDNVQNWNIKGVEREIGESWLGETYVFEVDELTEVTEFEEVLQ